MWLNSVIISLGDFMQNAGLYVQTKMSSHGRYGSNFKSVIFEHIHVLQIKFMSTYFFVKLL